MEIDGITRNLMPGVQTTGGRIIFFNIYTEKLA